jgi:hypothetical protein
MGWPKANAEEEQDNIDGCLCNLAWDSIDCDQWWFKRESRSKH